MTEATTEIVQTTNTSNFVATMAKDMKRSEDEVKAMIQLSFPTLKTGGQLTAAFANAKRYDLDPFAKEIYAYLDGKGQLVMITANSGFLKIARKQPGFISINSFAVYESDVFEMENGTVTKHQFNSETLAKRKGQNPIGAYAVLKMEGQEQPIYNWVDWSEYVPANAGYGPWAKQKSAMIRKCATSVLCREQFGLSGLYDETEMTEDLERSSNTISAQELSNDSRFKRAEVIASSEPETLLERKETPPATKKTTAKATAKTPASMPIPSNSTELPTTQIMQEELDAMDDEEYSIRHDNGEIPSRTLNNPDGTPIIDEGDTIPKVIPTSVSVSTPQTATASNNDNLPPGIDQLNRIADLCKQLGYSEKVTDDAIAKLSNRTEAQKAITKLLEKIAERASDKIETPKESSVKKTAEKVETEYAEIKADPRFKQMCGDDEESTEITAEEASEAFGQNEDDGPDPTTEKVSAMEYLDGLSKEELEAFHIEKKQLFREALANLKKSETPENERSKKIQSAWCATINETKIKKGYGIA